MEGDWGWGGSNLQRLLTEIIPRLHNLETMTWQQLRNDGSHPIAADQVCKEARERLDEIGKGDEESLYSIRVTGRCRVWGIRRGAILHLLWWDPEHSVYPVFKKNT